jgi:hypothetical protein
MRKINFVNIKNSNMGKYKSYIFLGLTVLILLILGYCVAKKRTGKKEEEIIKEVVKTEEVINDSLTKSPERKGEVIITERKKIIQRYETVVKPESQISESPMSKQVQQEIYDAQLEFRGNNYISWNSKLANSATSLFLVIERGGNQVDMIEVTGKIGHTYSPGSEGDLKKTKVLLKIDGVQFKGKTSFTTNEFTCSVH